MRDPLPALRSAGRAAQRGLRTVCSPTGLAGVGTELAWVAAHGALYPLGALAERHREHLLQRVRVLSTALATWH